MRSSLYLLAATIAIVIVVSACATPPTPVPPTPLPTAIPPTFPPPPTPVPPTTAPTTAPTPASTSTTAPIPALTAAPGISAASVEKLVNDKLNKVDRTLALWNIQPG